MTNEEKAKAAEAEAKDFNARFEALLEEAKKLSTMEDFYFKPTAEMQRRMQLLAKIISDEQSYQALANRQPNSDGRVPQPVLQAMTQNQADLAKLGN